MCQLAEVDKKGLIMRRTTNSKRKIPYSEKKPTDTRRRYGLSRHDRDSSAHENGNHGCRANQCQARASVTQEKKKEHFRMREKATSAEKKTPPKGRREETGNDRRNADTKSTRTRYGLGAKVQNESTIR